MRRDPNLFQNRKPISNFPSAQNAARRCGLHELNPMSLVTRAAPSNAQFCDDRISQDRRISKARRLIATFGCFDGGTLDLYAQLEFMDNLRVLRSGLGHDP